MEKIFKKNDDGSLLVSIAYGQEDYVPVLNKVARKLAEDVQVKGFRKGKAPMDVAIRYINNDDMYNGMVKKLIDRDFPGIIDEYEEKESVANIQPALNIDYDDKAKVYTFQYTFVFLPTVGIKKTSGYDIKLEVAEVTDEEINAKVTVLQKDLAELVPSDKEAKMGDTVNIDFTGFINNQTFDGGSAKSYDLVLGSNSFVPGFEEGVVGLKEGEKKNVMITFPENYVPALAGKEARFEIKVNSVKESIVPELDDEFAKSVDKYEVETIDALKEKIKDELAAQHAANARTMKINNILEKIVENSTFVISDRYIAASAENINEQKLQQIKQYGLGKDEYLKLINLSEEEFDAQGKEQAIRDAKTLAVCQAIIAQEKLEVTEDEIVEKFGGKEKYESFLATAEKDGNQAHIKNYLDMIKRNLLNQKVEEYLLANN